jgi:hypothetical protein
MRGGILWGRGDEDADSLSLTVTGLSLGCRPGEFLYALETPDISGIFALKEDGRVEQRLLHTSDYRVGQLNARPDGARIAFVVRDRAPRHVGAPAEGCADRARGGRAGRPVRVTPRRRRIAQGEPAAACRASQYISS